MEKISKLVEINELNENCISQKKLVQSMNKLYSRKIHDMFDTNGNFIGKNIKFSNGITLSSSNKIGNILLSCINIDFDKFKKCIEKEEETLKDFEKELEIVLIALEKIKIKKD